MKCPRCQADNEQHLKFCEECGAPLTRACPNCGAQVRPGKKFCGECGTTLESGPAARFASPQQYTPKHLAERILLSKEALEGERKQVTVLFADLKGSMELLADRDPEEARKPLDPVLEKMIEAVHRYEGTVNQVMGDGVMALFGAPLALEDQGWTVLESGSVSYGKATSYLPVIDLLKGYLRIHDGDTHRDIREKLAGKLMVLDETLKPLQPALLGLLGVSTQDEQWERLDPLHRRQRTLEACRRLLLRESQMQPQVLVFEDLHWIDTETQAFLDSFVESLPTAKILLLVNYRPEYAHRWGAKSYYAQLQVVPLPPQSAEALLEPLLGTDPGLHPIKKMLIERTGGNPLFLEESVRSLVETGVLGGTRGAFRLARVSHAFEVPATVQAILAARIDRLAPADKRLLQAASVIGKDVPYALLERVASMSEDELHQRLAALQAAEFLYETSLFPDLEYTFKHALTHEVAYNSMLHESRKGLHSRIVEAMEALYADRLTEQVERVAQHAFRGELWSKAVSYFAMAGEKAIHRSAHRDGVAAIEQALAGLQHLPRTREVLEHGVDLRLRIRGSLIALGEHERILNHAREAERLAKELGDLLREGWSVATLCIPVSTVDGPEQGLEYGERAVSIARETQDTDLESMANFALGIAHLWLGQYRTAIPYLYHSAEVARSSPESQWDRGLSPGVQRFASQNIHTWANASTAWCLAELGDFQEAVVRGEEARRIAETADLPYPRGAAYEFLGFVYLRQGHLEPAITLLEQCLDLSRTADLPVLVVQMAMRLGYAYVLAGRVTEAIAVLEEGRDLGDATRNMVWVPLTHAHLAEAYALAGRFDDALRTGHHAIELTQQYKERSYEAWARYLLGNVHALRRPAADLQSARAAYLGALEIASELGMRPLIAQSHLALGSLPAGDVQESRAHVETAVTMLHEMGMQFWFEKAQTALKAPA